MIKDPYGKTLEQAAQEGLEALTRAVNKALEKERILELARTNPDAISKDKAVIELLLRRDPF